MSDRARIERLNETLTQLEQMLGQSEHAAEKRVRGFVSIARIAAALTAVLALANLYFINDLTQEIHAVIARMEQMNSHFDQVADRMNAMRVQVEGMEENVRLMPVMDAQMREIASHVASMRGNVEQMRGITDSTARRIGRMNVSVTDMAARFHHLNASIGAIGGDVNQMALPVP